MVFGVKKTGEFFKRAGFCFGNLTMDIKDGQSVIEYVLLTALVILALVAGANLGTKAFNRHFDIAASENFKGGGTAAK